VLSLFRLACYANEWVVTAPAAMVVLALAFLSRARTPRGPRPAHGPVLVLASLALLAFSIVWNPKLGPYRDWDLFALMGLPFSLWAAHEVWARLQPGAARYATLTLAAASMTHTVTWIVYHAIPG